MLLNLLVSPLHSIPHVFWHQRQSPPKVAIHCIIHAKGGMRTVQSMAVAHREGALCVHAAAPVLTVSIDHSN
jgi:hypothetical protein